MLLELHAHVWDAVCTHSYLSCCELQVSAWVNFIRGENLFYPACTGQYNGKQCNKKLSDQGNGW